jgi:glutamate 5-kinase
VITLCPKREFATGGMVTKLVAARIATCSGCRCVAAVRGSAAIQR